MDKLEFDPWDELTITFDVKNTGSYAGKESVLLFVSDLVASVTPDIRRLRAFDKIELQPGDVQKVTMTLKAADLAFVAPNGKWVIEVGDYRVQVANQSLMMKCKQAREWSVSEKP